MQTLKIKKILVNIKDFCFSYDVCEYNKACDVFLTVLETIISWYVYSTQ